MDLFREMREAVGDWIALVRPAAPHAVVTIMFDFKRSLPAPAILCYASAVRPTDPAAVRARLVAAVQAFIDDAYPDAEYWCAAHASAGAPKAMFFVSESDGRCEESIQSDDFEVEDMWPINPDGTRGLRKTTRCWYARESRRTARWYAKKNNVAESERATSVSHTTHHHTQRNRI
jgi:hypothetical protein